MREPFKRDIERGRLLRREKVFAGSVSHLGLEGKPDEYRRSGRNLTLFWHQLQVELRHWRKRNCEELGKSGICNSYLRDNQGAF